MYDIAGENEVRQNVDMVYAPDKEKGIQELYKSVGRINKKGWTNMCVKER